MKRSLFFGHLTTILSCLLIQAFAVYFPVDIIRGRHYEGKYYAIQQSPTFDYLQNKQGRLVAIFTGSPNHGILWSLTLYLMDPLYKDSNMIIVQLKDILDIGPRKEWMKENHSVVVSKLWKGRKQESQSTSNVTTLIRFENLQDQNYQTVEIHISMKGANFELSSQLHYYNQILSSLTYSLYVSALALIQVITGYRLLRKIELRQMALGARLSCLVVSMCAIQDLGRIVDHIHNIITSESGYLIFIMPMIAYIFLFVIIDIKMLFLVWRSSHLRDTEHRSRKQLAALYAKLLFGFTAYLALSYFFRYDQWMIVLSNAILMLQVVHNMRLGINPGFNFPYIFGYIGSRLLLPIYERLCPQNRFALSPNLLLVAILVSLYSLFVALLFFQYRLGPRFFLPKRFRPKQFNYSKRAKREGQSEQNECSICLEALFEGCVREKEGQGINSSQQQLEQALETERQVMQTPCRHIFHQECLLRWMEVRLACPSCRGVLPQF